MIPNKPLLQFILDLTLFIGFSTGLIGTLRSKHDTFDTYIHGNHILVHCIWEHFMVLEFCFHLLRDDGLLKKAEAYSEPSQISEKELFAKMNNK